MSSIWEELGELEQQKHPLKNIFRRYGIKQATIAKWLQTSPGRVSEVLNGVLEAPEAMEKKLQDLADRIAAEAE